MSYSEVIKHAEELLGEQGGSSLSGGKIAEHLDKKMIDGVIEKHPRTSILALLSKAANHDEDSRIISGGPHGGYSLEPLVHTVDDGSNKGAAENNERSEFSGAYAPKEYHLYPLIQAWLEASEYVSADLSRLKAGGQWGNPDVMGISHIEVLGFSEIELVSVEAKLSEKD